MITSSAVKREFKQTFRSLRYRNFRLYFFGQLVSLSGTWMQNVALSWLVYRLTHSAAWLGFMESAYLLPMLFLGLISGWLADRYNRRSILLITQALAMCQSLILAFLTIGHGMRVEYAVALAAFLGIVTAVEIPSRQAFLIDMIERDDVVNAVSLNSSLFNSARFIGPAIAGIVVSVAGEAACFLINALSFLATIIALLAIRIKIIPAHASITGEPFSLKQAFQFVIGNPIVRLTLLLALCMSIFGMQYTVLLPVMAAEVLHGGVGILGTLRATAGVGALCATLTLANRARGGFLSIVIGCAAIAFGIALFTFSRSANLPLSLFLLLIVGLTMTTFLSGSHALVQLAVPDNLRGRVMSIYMTILLGINPLGSCLVGLSATRFGAPNTIMVCSLVSIMAGIVYLFVLARTRATIGTA